jgi:CIC family chloride channel protein
MARFRKKRGKTLEEQEVASRSQLPAWFRVRSRVGRALDRLEVSEEAVLTVTAVLVGLLTGVGTILFIWLLDVFGEGFGWLNGQLSQIHPWATIAVPALGGMIAGPLIYFFAREAKGHGVPEVMQAIALRGGRIRPPVVIIKALASAACIGSGGSAGREGPIVQIGSALGSVIGQLTHLSDERIRNLVACGSAAGIAATFNAPIAGVVFALEVILGEFTTRYFATVVISAVTASIVSQTVLGATPAFVVPAYSLAHPVDLLFYTAVGVLAPLIAWLFVTTLYYAEDRFDEWKFPEWLKPAIGGVAVGIVGLRAPQALGTGFAGIESALHNEMAMAGMLGLLIAKLLTTDFTLGSGNSGGVFAPALYMGAMLGGAYGDVIHRFFPTVTGPLGAYALVGMAAVFAGAAHAPMTGMLIVFEMSGDYRLILPLMLATGISTVITQRMRRDSIYTLKLSRRGIHLERGRDVDVMQGVTVGEAMTTDVDVVPGDMTLEGLSQEFARTHHHGFPVVDDAGLLIGVVSIQDLERALARGLVQGKTVADIATTKGVLVAYPHEPMWKALRRLGTRDVSRLPVVVDQGSRKLVGVVRRADIVRAYNAAIVKRARHQHRIETLRLGKIDEAAFVHIEIPADAEVVGKRIGEIPLPEDSVIVSVRRDRRLIVAHGYTALHGGDRVTVFAENECLPQVRRRLMSVSAEQMEEQVARYREITIPPGSSAVGRRVADLSLPPDCILVSVHRGDHIIVPRGDTVLQPEDVVEVFGLREELEQANACLAA